MNDPLIENETIHDFLNSGTIHEHTSSLFMNIQVHELKNIQEHAVYE
jgi:pimeloyl-CoA synthetase